MLFTKQTTYIFANHVSFLYIYFIGYFEFKDGAIQKGPKAERNEWGDLVLHYWPILLIVLLVAIMVASMPIIGWVKEKRT